MILLRQKLYADKKQKSYRKQHRAAKKGWEEAEGGKILLKDYGIGGTASADEIAKKEIQLEKNGADTIHLSGFMDFRHQKRPEKTDKPETIEVKADEIARKKVRDRTHHNSRNGRLYQEDYYGHDKYHSPEVQKKGIEELSKDRYGELKRKFYRGDKSNPSEYTLDLKDRARKRKLTDRAERIRKNKPLRQRIKEDLGIGMSKSAKERFKKLNEVEDQVLLSRLKKHANDEGVHIDESIESIFKPAAQSNIKRGKNAQSVVVAHDAPGLAHELGHAHFESGKKNVNKVGAVAHKLYMGTGRHVKATKIAGISSGVAAGVNKAIKEDKGKKESTLEKLSPALTSLAVASPMLISEAAASRHGIKVLKNAKASRRFQNHAKRDLAAAFGTYAAVPVISTAEGYLAKGVSYRATKGALKHKNKKDKDK